MNWDVVAARVLEPGGFWVKFADGLEGTVHFASTAYRAVFAKHSAHESSDEIDEATEPGRDGIPAESGEANPESGIPGGDGHGRTVASPGVAD